MVFKKDADLGNDGRTVRIFGCRDFNGCNQVFLTVRPQRTDRELRAGQDDGLTQILEHETESRSCIGHCVGAVQDHKAVKRIVVVVYYFNQFGPKCRFHIRGVDGGIKLVRRDTIIESF